MNRVIGVLLLSLLAPAATVVAASAPAAAPAPAVPGAPASSNAPAPATSPQAVLSPEATQPNPMHPPFVVLDEAGAAVAASHRTPSAVATCGACHDAQYINAHSDHWNARVKATCADCHFEGGQLPRDPAAFDETGRLRREAIRISVPRDANCASCHGIVHQGRDPVSIPADFGPRGDADSSRACDLTLQTGAIISAQDLAGSFLNLRRKTELNYPWDVHARRQVHCVDCHFSPNNPVRSDSKRARLDFVVDDPRRIPLSQFLHQPDHRMAAATCRSCHDPMKTHDFLPYKQRHFESLECEACHVPHPMGPAVESIDATVITPDGRSAVQYRGVERGPNEPLNAAYARGYSPLLLASRGSGGGTKLAPFNAAETWFWADGPGGEPLPTALVARAYLEGGRYTPEILAVFDADHDGRLDPPELRLDSAAKTDLVRSRLRALGVDDPRIRREVSFYPVAHGVQAGEQVQRDCGSCHEKESRLNAGLALASYTPAGAEPSSQDPSTGSKVNVRFRSGGGADSVIPGEFTGLYILGHSRRGWGDRLGFSIFLAVVLGIAAHALFRVISRPAHERTGSAGARRVYLYTVYERLWHWTMGLSILVLMLTGLQVHFFGAWKLLSLPKAVAIHNFFAVVLTVNAFLSLFYHLATSAIRQFVPSRKNLVDKVAAQARYYTRGIFLGQPHPSPKTPERKMNPLQQITYLALLNILFPIQVVTGVLIWGASRWPHLAQATGGLTYVAPLHSLCAWFFLAFVLAHVYLTTTGSTVFSNIIAMIDGFEKIELKRHPVAGETNA